MSQLQLKLPKVDGQPILPSAAKGPGGEPRFYVPLLRELIDPDPGVRYLMTYEALYGGYEASSRQFFEEHLQPGDVFVDVGAHWGVFTFSAATRFPGQVTVLAVEPHPVNAAQLLKGVRINGLLSSVRVVAAAAGASQGVARLRHDTTMGHSLDERTPIDAKEPVLIVPVVTLDGLFDEHPEFGGRRAFLKIDVEGFELEVVLGARRLLESGRVAAVMWEKGHAYAAEPGRARLARLLEQFARLGYECFRFPSSEFAGPLIPFAPTPEIGNVFALSAGFERRRAYALPFEPRPPFNRLFATPADPVTRARTAELLLRARSSDGARWADPQELAEGAQERAAAASQHVLPGSRVLDLGAGSMALKALLPPGCRYTPADLLARSADCQVVDLNQRHFPRGAYDCVVLLEVLEYLHDAPWLLQRCRQAAPRLIFTYHVRGPESVEDRRQRGWFSDLDADELCALLGKAGWRMHSESALGEARLLVCGGA
jgi:FkbM family methyltransferase